MKRILLALAVVGAIVCLSVGCDQALEKPKTKLSNAEIQEAMAKKDALEAQLKEQAAGGATGADAATEE